MNRRALQSAVLAIWLLGLMSQLWIWGRASEARVDSFVVNETLIKKFEAFCRMKLPSDKVSPLVAALVHVMDDARVRDQRTGLAFETYVRREIDAANAESSLSLSSSFVDDATDWFGGNAAERRLPGIRTWIFQLYIPWLATMIAGILTDSRASNAIRIIQARTALALAVGVQAVSAWALHGYLFKSDIGGSSAFPIEVTAFNSVVAAIIYFAFPKVNA